MSILSDYKAKMAKMNSVSPGFRIEKARAELRTITAEFKEVLAAEDLDWEVRYDLVFETHQSRVKELLAKAYLDLNYYDPDTSFEEDAWAYVNALERLLEE